MKKTIILTVAAALFISTQVTAFACTNNSYRAQVRTTTVCAEENCTLTDYHYHDGIGYAGHNSADGHLYHNNTYAGHGHGYHNSNHSYEED